MIIIIIIIVIVIIIIIVIIVVVVVIVIMLTFINPTCNPCGAVAILVIPVALMKRTGRL